MNRLIEHPSHLEFSGWSGTPAERSSASAGLLDDLENLMPKLKLIVVTGLYMAALLWAYVTIVSPEFGYEGFTVRWPGSVIMLWLFTVALLPCLLLPYSLSQPSGLILWWLYVSTYIPAILVPALTLSMPYEELLPLHISLLLCMGLLCLIPSVRPFGVRRIALSPSFFWTAFFLVWGVSLAYICITGRIGTLAANLAAYIGGESEYTIRTAYKDLASQSSILLGYVVGQLGQALDPFLIAFGLVYRRRLCLALGILGQVIIFSLTGFKGVLLSSLFLAFVAVLMGRWRHSFGPTFTAAMLGIVLFSTVADLAHHNQFFTKVITRRTLLAPGLLTGFYFERYSQVPPVGIGFHFTHDEAVLTPPNEIGIVYWRDSDVAANANLWAQGFAELGFPGIFAFTLVAGFALWMFDSLAAQRDLVTATLLTAMPAVAFSNTSPLTVFVSHGGLAIALVLYMWPAPQPEEVCEAEIEETQLLPSAGPSVEIS
jgi:hypothetical protein